MSNSIHPGIVALGVLILALFVAALRGCENPPSDPVGPPEYDNSYDTGETTAVREPTVQYPNEHIQYPNELPDTGGIRL